VVGILQDRLAHVDARRADDDVEAVLRGDAIEGGVDGRRLTDVEDARFADAAFAAGARRHLARRLFVDVEAHDARALAGAAKRDRFAYSGRAANHRGGFSFQAEQIHRYTISARSCRPRASMTPRNATPAAMIPRRL